MADQGILAQSKPAANTNTVLYRAPVDASASTALSIANDGTASTFDLAVKDYDQRLTVDASTYLLHPGDTISGYSITVDTNMTASSGFSANQLITTDDGEKSFRFESFRVPAVTTYHVKVVTLRPITVESVSGTFTVGSTLTTGTSPDDTTAVIYGIQDLSTSAVLYVGPSTINGSGAEFADGDSVSITGASGTIATSGVGTGTAEFVISTTGASGTYGAYLYSQVPVFTDRTYRFDVSDSSMTGRDFRLSLTANGIYGPDGIIFGQPGGATDDDGVEYTFGKTTNGTAGSTGAYVQYDLNAGSTTNDPATSSPYLSGSFIYFYDHGDAAYGGSDRQIQLISSTSFNEFFIFDLDGTLATSTDTFIVQGVTYTITAISAGPYGFVRRYSGTTLDVIKGPGSQDFAGTDTFKDVPKSTTATRSLVTVSSVDVDVAAVNNENYLAVDHANANNNVERITSLVVGPGEVVVVNSTTQNNVFSLVGFEDSATSFATRVFNQS